MNSKRIPSAWLVCLLIGLPQISETIYTPSLPTLSTNLGCSAHQAEWTLSIYFIGFALGVGLWGRLADRYGRRPIMLLGLFLYGLSDILCIYVDNVSQLMILRFFQALGVSVGSVITQTMIRECYHGAARGKLFALVGMSLSFSPALGPLIGGFLDASYGWRANFTGLAMMGGAALLLSVFHLPETLQKHPSITKVSFIEVMTRMIKDKFVIQCIIIVGILNGILFSYYSEAPFIFTDMLDFSPKQYGLTGLVIGCAGFLGSMTTKRLLNHYSERQIVLLGSMINILGSVWMLLAMLLIKEEMSWLIASQVLCAMFVMIFGGMALAIPNVLSIALKDYGDCLGTAGSIMGLGYYVVVALLTFLMGVIHNGSLMAMPSYFVCLSVIFMGLAWRMNEDWTQSNLNMAS